MLMKTIIISNLLCIALNLVLWGQELPLTVAEESGYKSTSTYSEVMDFVKEVDQGSKYLGIEYFAATVYGKKASSFDSCRSLARESGRINN